MQEKHLFAQVSYKEFLSIMEAPLNKRKYYITHGHLTDKYVYLYRGDRHTLKVKLEYFSDEGRYNPDFNKFDIIDCGQSITFGDDYEIGVDSILYEFDSVCKKEMDKNAVSGSWKDIKK